VTSGDPAADHPAFDRVENYVLASGRTAIDAAREVARDADYEPLVLSSTVRGEASDAALTHVAIAESAGEGRPSRTTRRRPLRWRVHGHRRGRRLRGPNQEFALAAAVELPDDAVLASVDTDGVDGFSEVAGAIVDASTGEDRATARDALARNDAGTYLTERGATIRTGPTGTNVNDLHVLRHRVARFTNALPAPVVWAAMRAESTVGVVVFEGFEELDAVGPYDVLQTAAREGAPVTTELLVVDETDLVTASKGLRVEPDGVLAVADADAPDVLVVPGGGWNSREESGAWAEAERGVLPDRIAACHEQGTTVASVCTGGMILDRAGLLDGRPAVTHGGALSDLREGRRTSWTRASSTTATFHLRRRHGRHRPGAVARRAREWGADVAAAVATELEYERSQDVYRTENSRRSE